jgi:phospholipase/carboxylesterase
MHGYGSNMSDLVSLAPMVMQEGYLFAFPNAPIRLDFGMGMVGYAWSAPLEADFDEHGRAEGLLETMIDDVISRYGVEEGRVVIGGFSQGGMMALRHGLRHPDRFPGIVALSSRLPQQDRPSQTGDATRGQRVFIAHGTYDDVIHVQEGRSAHDVLSGGGYPAAYHEYGMAHQIIPEVIADLSAWLTETLLPLP